VIQHEAGSSPVLTLVFEATPELARARSEQLASFTHFLDIPILVVIVSLGALRPNGWTQFIVATALAVAVASLLNYTIPRLYLWCGEGESKSSCTRQL
jgi:hypothetical protein